MKIEKFLHVTIACFVFIGVVVGTMSSRRTLCLENERDALLMFKQGLINDYGILSSWGSEDEKKECCNWKGVECSNKTGHVLVLDLHCTPLDGYSHCDQYLQGNITSSLAELQYLRHLDLSYNDFGGSRIPDFVGLFPRMKYLNLRNANFKGETPHTLGNLTSLQVLDLGGNFELVMKDLEWIPSLVLLSDLNLYGVRVETVNWLQQIIRSPSLENLDLGSSLHHTEPNISTNHLLTNISSRLLSSLSLRYNGLSSSAFRWLFNMSTRLTSIDLSSNLIEGLIPEYFGSMKHLQVINLAGNALEGGLPNSFRNLIHLKALNLDGNRLSQPLPELLLSLSGKVETSLEELLLSRNELSGSLPDITRFSSLKDLYLDNNQLNGSFLENYGRSSKIEYLDLSDNQMIGPLPNLTKFPSLRELYLYNNQFKGRLFQSIGQFPMLEKLDVNSNHLGGSITEAHLSKLSNLKKLDLSNNSFSLQLGTNWIPPFELDVIRLSRCEMGPGFPQWLQTQKNYSELDISFANISDVAPYWLWNLSPNLGYFNISNNQISGEVPDLSLKFVASMEFGFPRIDFSSNHLSGLVPTFPSNLTSLHLSKNKFIGPISFLCRLANPWFSSIDLSDNLLSGEIPDCWMGFDDLTILNLANNKLHGKVPDSIGSLFSIMSLQLRNNNLTGYLPESLKNCTELKILDIGDNKLSGEIPSWIGSHLTNLIVLSLRTNRFNGSIPHNLCHLNQVHILDLSQNNLSGDIPRCLNNITSLLRINDSVSSILFDVVGYDGSYYTVAEYMGDAFILWKNQEYVLDKKLGLYKLVDFSSNELVGTIPEEIGQLGGLNSLNLSRNKLTGSIPESIGKIKRLEWFDLSNNQLAGRIPQGFVQLNFLSSLNLSRNNLSGKIPTSTQLQSFDPSSYEENNNLCGPPLVECPGDRNVHGPSEEHSKGNSEIDEDDRIVSVGLYVSVASGFILGFWGLIFTLILNKPFRHAYFQLWANCVNWSFVTTVLVSVHRLKRLLI